MAFLYKKIDYSIISQLYLVFLLDDEQPFWAIILFQVGHHGYIYFIYPYLNPPSLVAAQVLWQLLTMGNPVSDMPKYNTKSIVITD